MQGVRFAQLVHMGPAFGADWAKMRREQRLAAATAGDGDPDDSTALLPNSLEPTGDDDRPRTYEDAVNRVWAVIAELKDEWLGNQYDLLHRSVETVIWPLLSRAATVTASATSLCIA